MSPRPRVPESPCPRVPVSLSPRAPASFKRVGVGADNARCLQRHTGRCGHRQGNAMYKQPRFQIGPLMDLEAMDLLSYSCCRSLRNTIHRARKRAKAWGHPLELSLRKRLPVSALIVQGKVSSQYGFVRSLVHKKRESLGCKSCRFRNPAPHCVNPFHVRATSRYHSKFANLAGFPSVQAAAVTYA